MGYVPDDKNLRRKHILKRRLKTKKAGRKLLKRKR